MDNKARQRLPAEALADLRAIYEGEFGEPLGPAEAEEMGERLLRLFGLLGEGDGGIELTPRQFAALRHVHERLEHHRRQPTARSTAAAIGRRSSRTGMRALDELVELRAVWRNRDGSLEIAPGHCDYWGCAK